ncbi:potassium channel family protein [Kutzneria sp. CA-103260]|uniref:potassium channel family protein n=1 Tax=Kutzneria sp. CA-103260 TaxID=2802641 RepID=UPI001BA88800|nr:TrkA family potassium uptake protein [Kutzneria sp. CA-103260]QUQ64089.1 trk system potassium uptake protein TrkA [Kutzneria sp. CA-103260]
MKIIIAGLGHLGEQAGHLLAAAGHQVTAIERDRARADALAADHLVRLVHGDACEPVVLESAGALTADLLLAATGEDEDNLVISLLAKRQFQIHRTLARVNDPDNAWLFDGRWGVDAALPASAPLVSLIEEAADIADTIGLVRLASAGVTLIETKITVDSFAAGRAVDELALPPNTVVAAVIHDGALSVPGGDYRFRPADAVLVITGNATESDIRAAFQREPAG